MTRPRLVIALAFLALIPAAPGFSQTPVGTAFARQGYLDDAGAPANGSFDFRFILYDASIGGNQVGPIVTRGDVPVVEGVFAVSLNFGAAFTGYRRWLETSVRPGDSTDVYTILSPREELMATPTALWSATSATTPWAGISGMPAGFADGVDNDTTYTVGAGLSMQDNEIRIPQGGVTASMIQNGQVDVSKLNLPNVDARYVSQTQLRAGIDSSPTMCNNTEPVVFSLPSFSSPPAVVISSDDVSNSAAPPNTFCVLDGVTKEGFRYCCFGTTPRYVRWIAVSAN